MQQAAVTSQKAGAADRSAFIARVYEDLHAVAALHLRHERRGHTLTATAVVHEVYLRLAENDRLPWTDRTEFLALASAVIRHVLVDHARRRRAAKRDGGRRAPLVEEAAGGGLSADQILAVDEALAKLASLDPRQARVVELRVFGCLSVEEAAEALGVSPPTLKRDWRLAKAWLARWLQSSRDS